MHYLHLKFFAPRLKLLQCDMAGLPLMSLPSLGVSSLDLGRHRMAAFFFFSPAILQPRARAAGPAFLRKDGRQASRDRAAA